MEKKVEKLRMRFLQEIVSSSLVSLAFHSPQHCMHQVNRTSLVHKDDDGGNSNKACYLSSSAAKASAAAAASLSMRFNKLHFAMQSDDHSPMDKKCLLYLRSSS